MEMEIQTSTPVLSKNNTVESLAAMTLSPSVSKSQGKNNKEARNHIVGLFNNCHQKRNQSKTKTVQVWVRSKTTKLQVCASEQSKNSSTKEVLKEATSKDLFSFLLSRVESFGSSPYEVYGEGGGHFFLVVTLNEW